MPSIRKPLWLVLGLAGLALAGAAVWQNGRSETAAAPSSREGEAVAIPQEPEIRFLNEQPVRLEPGARLQEELKGGEGRRYELALEEGQLAHVVVEQQGIDVAVLVQRPGQEGKGEVDSPNGRDGPEIVYQLAQQTGLHRLEVVCGDFTAAPGKYEIRLEALRTAGPEDRAFYEAWKLFRKGETQRQKNNFREALGFYEQVLPTWRQLGRQDWEAETLHRMGRVQMDLGRYPEAVEAFQAALPWFRQHGPRFQEGEILSRIGRLLFFQGDSDGALRYGEEARALFHEIGELGLEAEALSNLGDLWNRRGQTEKALELLTPALELARRSGDPKSEAFTQHILAETHLLLGQFASSLDAFQEALRLEEKAGELGDKATTLRAMADLHLRQKEMAAARRRLDEALALERGREYRDGEAVVLNSLGALTLEEGRPDEARSSFERALALFRGSGNRYGEAFSLLNLGRALYAAKDMEGALRLHEEAASLLTKLEYRRGLVSTLYGSARALNALGRFSEAEQRLEQVGSDTELLRSGAESSVLRGTFFATKQHYFDLYVDVLMSLHRQQPEVGYDHLALEVNERRRARSLLDEIGGRASVRPDADPQLVARRDELLRTIEDVEQELLDRSGAGADGEAIEALEQRLRVLLGELDRVRTTLLKDGRQRGGLSEPRPLGLEGMQELLDPKTLLLVFSLGEERSYLWCVGHQGRLESRTLPDRSWIEDRVDELSRRWSRRARDGRQEERFAEQLSEALLGKVAGLLGTKRLVIVADGALQGLSFAALPDPVPVEGGATQPLLARHEIVYLPSASVLAVLRQELQNRSQAPVRLLLVADPVFSTDDPRVQTQVPKIPAPQPHSDLGRAGAVLGTDPYRPLPFSGQEAEAIAELLPEEQRRVLSGFAADLEAVEKGDLRRYAIVHFATHGLVHPRYPELSGLVLSQISADGLQRQGFLRAHRIADLDLRADLAVLSACETGVGTDLRGEGTQALTRSFMRAGVPRLVVSLWEVSDRGTAELMKRFYRGLIQHRLPQSQALRCAQLSMLGEKQWADPFYWAPFVFQGEWEKRVGQPPVSDGSIERKSGGGMISPIPDDGFPPPDTDPPKGCPDLTRDLRKPGQEG